MDKEIIIGNKLIAEFMGGKYFEAWENEHYNAPYAHWYFENEPTIETKVMRELIYHSSWDWLMPVVEKIESSADQQTGHITVVIQGQMCEILQYDFQKRARYSHGSEPKITIVWKAVVQFIKWYNDSNQPQGGK